MPKPNTVEDKSAVSSQPEQATLKELISSTEDNLNQIFDAISTSKIEAEKKLDPTNRIRGMKAQLKQLAKNTSS